MMSNSRSIYNRFHHAIRFGRNQSERSVPAVIILQPEQLRKYGLQNDREIILSGVKKDGLFLRHASRKLQNDKDIVLAAVGQNQYALQYASETLKDDKDVVLAAIQESELPSFDILQYASENVKNCSEIVLEAVRRNGYILWFLSDELKNNKDIALAAVRQSGKMLQFVSKALQNDKELVRTAIRQDGCLLRYASEAIQNDKDIVLEAAKQNGNVLRITKDKYRNDKDVVIAALQSNTSQHLIDYASDEIQCHPEVVFQVVLSKIGGNVTNMMNLMNTNANNDKSGHSLPFALWSQILAKGETEPYYIFYYLMNNPYLVKNAGTA